MLLSEFYSNECSAIINPVYNNESLIRNAAAAGGRTDEGGRNCVWKKKPKNPHTFSHLVVRRLRFFLYLLYISLTISFNCSPPPIYHLPSSSTQKRQQPLYKCENKSILFFFRSSLAMHTHTHTYGRKMLDGDDDDDFLGRGKMFCVCSGRWLIDQLDICVWSIEQESLDKRQTEKCWIHLQ